MNRNILLILMITLSGYLFAGRPNDIEFAVIHLLESVESECHKIFDEEQLNLIILDHHQKSYYSSQYYGLNFIKDSLITSTIFPNEIEVILVPIIENYSETFPMQQEDELNFSLTISNKNNVLSKKYDDNIVIKIKIISSNERIKKILIGKIRASGLKDKFNEINRTEEMMGDNLMYMILE